MESNKVGQDASLVHRGRPAQGSIREQKGNLQVRVALPADPITGKRRQRTKTVEGTSQRAYRQAQRIRTAMLAEVEAERELIASGQQSLGALLDDWIETTVPRLSGNTVRTNRLNAEFYLKPLRPVPVSELTVQMIESLFAKLHAVGAEGGKTDKGLAPDTIRRIHGTLHRALQYGVRWGWCQTNVASLVEHVKIEKKDREMPDPDELRKFIALVQYEDPSFAMWLRLAAVTGARRGEVCGLRWTDVDFAKGDLLIARAVVIGTGPNGKEKAYVRMSTKTNKPRRIALGPDTVKNLQGHLKRCQGAADACGTTIPHDAYLFAKEADGRDPWDPHRLSVRYRRTKLRLGRAEMGDDAVKLTGVRLGDLRHFVASQMLQAGEPVMAVAARLGNSPRTLMANYAHFIPGADREAAERMEGLIS